MLKLFANQRNSTAVLLRACLPVAVSSNLRNTHNLKNSRRSMSDFYPPESGSIQVKPSSGPLPSTAHFHVWSLISKQGDSFLEIVDMEDHERPSLKCTGMYDETASLVNMIDSTKFPTPSVSFQLTLKDQQFYLSLQDKDVVARPLENGKPQPKDEERFIHLIHGSYSMFESKKHRDEFLGSYKDGSLHLIDVYDKRHPDPRVLFLMHSKPIKR